MMQQSQRRTTHNENMLCRRCDTKGMLVHSGPVVQFQTERSYECEDCGHHYKLNDGEEVVIVQGGCEDE